MFHRGEAEEGAEKPIEPMEVRVKDSDAEVTVVGRGARLEGNVMSAGSLRVDGQVKGKISADGDVVLTGQSQVEADIQATNVVVAGRFKGTIVARNKAEVATGGRVEGNITSKALVVSEGASFSGQSIMDGGPGGTDSTAAGRPRPAARPDAAGAKAGPEAPPPSASPGG
jgi:cytoskeletal protein CcmA (bactofilin family)